MHDVDHHALAVLAGLDELLARIADRDERQEDQADDRQDDRHDSRDGVGGQRRQPSLVTIAVLEG